MPLAGRLTEIYVAEHRQGGSVGIVVDSRGGPEAVDERIAHGLGHHLLHAGNRLEDRAGAVWSGTHEREADDFAACLLVPIGELRSQLAPLDAPNVWELTSHFQVTEKMIRRRLELAGRAGCLTAISAVD